MPCWIDRNELIKWLANVPQLLDHPIPVTVENPQCNLIILNPSLRQVFHQKLPKSAKSVVAFEKNTPATRKSMYLSCAWETLIVQLAWTQGISRGFHFVMGVRVCPVIIYFGLGFSHGNKTAIWGPPMTRWVSLHGFHCSQAAEGTHDGGKLYLQGTQLHVRANPAWKTGLGTLWQTFIHNYGKSPFLVGKSTISMVMFKFANCCFTRG